MYVIVGNSKNLVHLKKVKFISKIVFFPEFLFFIIIIISIHSSLGIEAFSKATPNIRIKSYLQMSIDFTSIVFNVLSLRDYILDLTSIFSNPTDTRIK